MNGSADNSPVLLSRRELRGPTQWGVTGLTMLGTVLCVGGLFWPTVRSMAETWAGSRTFAHGFLILPAACYLVWCAREKWISLVPHRSWLGLMVLIAVSAGWIAADHLHHLAFQQVAVVAFFPSLTWAILGSDIVRALSWPLGFLVFMLPFGSIIEPRLQDFTAQFVLVGLQLTGIPTVYDRYFITIPSGIWEIAPDCGGLRYLLPGLALGTAFAIIAYRKPSHRVAFIALCAVILMLANGLRAYGIIVGDHIGIAEGADHRVFSYTIYALTIVLLYWIGMKWAEPDVFTSSQHETTAVWHSHVIHSMVISATAAILILAMGPLSGWLMGGQS